MCEAGADDRAAPFGHMWETLRVTVPIKVDTAAHAQANIQAAWDLGQKDPNFFYKDAVAKALVDWKGKK